jgi:peptidoglycan/LPS O-acetylase OafA/YrhL
MISSVNNWSERIYFLHFIRIFSALLVCLGHSKEFFIINISNDPTNVEKAMRLFLSLGNPAVLVFFFLSGFLVGGNELRRLSRNVINSRKYFLDRLTRLWSVLIPALVFTVMLNHLSCSEKRLSLYCTASLDLASHANYPPLELQNISIFITNLFFFQPFRGEIYGGNGPLWSLSYEFWYYVVFMCFVLLIGSFKYKKIDRGLFFFIPISFVGLLIVDLRWYFLGIIWLSGALMGYFIKDFSAGSYFSKLPAPNLFTVLILNMVFVLPAMIFVRIFPNSVLAYLIMIVLLSSAVTITRISNVEHKRNVSERIIVRGSEFSFSLYLIHFPLLGLISTYATPDSRWKLNSGSFSVVVLSVVLVAVIANFFAFFTEDRLINLRTRFRILYGRN